MYASLPCTSEETKKRKGGKGVSEVYQSKSKKQKAKKEKLCWEKDIAARAKNKYTSACMYVRVSTRKRTYVHAWGSKAGRWKKDRLAISAMPTRQAQLHVRWFLLRDTNNTHAEQACTVHYLKLRALVSMIIHARVARRSQYLAKRSSSLSVRACVHILCEYVVALDRAVCRACQLRNMKHDDGFIPEGFGSYSKICEYPYPPLRTSTGDRCLCVLMCEVARS